MTINELIKFLQDMPPNVRELQWAKSGHHSGHGESWDYTTPLTYNKYHVVQETDYGQPTGKMVVVASYLDPDVARYKQKIKDEIVRINKEKKLKRVIKSGDV